MSNFESALTIPQSISILHQAVLVGQKAGVYSLNDSVLIKKSLDSIRYRLHLDENFNPIGTQQQPLQQQQQPLQQQQPPQQQQLQQNSGVEQVKLDQE